MEAKELRIGNYVTNEMHGIGCVTAISGNDLLYDRNYDSLPIYMFEPIPLTEEWLIKLGYKNTEDLGDIVYCENGSKIGISLDHEELCVYWKIYKENYTVMIYDAEHFQSVHQLQNLYFALTGE